jgi:hypothetical protein
MFSTNVSLYSLVIKFSCMWKNKALSALLNANIKNQDYLDSI